MCIRDRRHAERHPVHSLLRHEEALLSELFGDAYRAYQRRVRRWI